jgi:hypothetical protein
MTSANVRQLVRGSELVQGEFFMSVSFVALAAAAAAQAAAPQTTRVDPAQARVQGFAQAQQALATGGAPTAAIAPATPIGASVTTSAVLRVGTVVPLRLVEELTTKGKKLRVGDRFHLETSEPVMVQGVNVIPVGSPAVGEITDARNKGMWGKSGHLAARVLYVTVNGRQIRLSGAFDDKGVAGGVGAVAAAYFFLPVGFFVTGTSALVPSGAIVKGFVDEDVPLSIAAAAPAPLAVGAAAPLTLRAPASAPAPGQSQ